MLKMTDAFIGSFSLLVACTCNMGTRNVGDLVHQSPRAEANKCNEPCFPSACDYITNTSNLSNPNTPKIKNVETNQMSMGKHLFM